MLSTILFISGLVLGLAIGLGLMVWRVRDIRSIHQNAMEEKQKQADAMLAQLKESFDSLSRQALAKNTEEFLKFAGENLSKHTQANANEMDGKKQLIDQTLKAMKQELDKVQNTVQDLEKDRKAKFDVLSKEITRTAEETSKLRETTSSLHNALTNSRVRGQWGERMAEDVLRLTGFIEGINYQKQSSVAGEENKTSRPDYTFYMPQNRVVHMDVKFPLDNYLRMVESESEVDSDSYKKAFLKDVKNRIKEIKDRGYINDETLDYVMLFIPNEQVYAFLNENDASILDEALNNKVVLCSPLTLYAILAVIRQAVDNFHLERTAGEILELLSSFHSQWDKFTDAMDKVGKKISESQRAFDDLYGTRRRMLEKPLNRIEQLRESEHLLEHEPKKHIRLVEEE